MTETSTANLAEWLLEQVMLDQATPAYCRCDLSEHSCQGRPGCPKRVRAECEAKRKIVDAYQQSKDALDKHAEAFARDFHSAAHHANYPDPRLDGRRMAEGHHLEGHRNALLGVLYLMALPYSDRPGYRPEWRPE